MNPIAYRALPAAILLALATSSCEINGEHGAAGPMVTDRTSVDLDQSEMVRAELKIGAGKIDIRGGSPKLLDGSFTYNDMTWKPQVHYSPSSFRGLLTIDQPNGTHNLGHHHYEWDLRFNNAKPLDMRVELGAGQADLDLSSLNLRGVDVQMGVGQLDLDLRGTPKSDYRVHIEGGVGQATVYLPHDVGVSADAHGGIGGIQVEGLHKDGGRWVNSAWDSAKVRVRVDVEGGIGSIHLIGD